MRVAAIYDIHANLPALEAALSAIDDSDVDLIVVGGDIAWGPLPRETMERLLTLGESARFIRGTPTAMSSSRWRQNRTRTTPSQP